jgi:hypothetical protein
MADTQAETDDELRIAARRVLRAARVRPTRQRRKGRLSWGALALLLVVAATVVIGLVISGQL